MLFSSVVFLFYFLPLILILYYTVCAPSIRLRNGLLLLASLFFYAWGEPKNIVLLLVSCLGNWLLGMGIHFWRRIAKPLLVLTCVLNLALLFVFKYLTFTTSTLAVLFPGLSLPQPNITLPIGISFFTFQAMSYVFDVYLGTVAVQKNPLYVALYVSLFPQLVAGPIVRYSTVEDQILHRTHSRVMFSNGVWRFVQGLGKKILLSNSFAIIADNVYNLTLAGHNQLSVPVTLAWLGSFAYTLQIFFDFSGYSDMAIGLGQMFGFQFEENFRYPYISRSVSEFWRRWHISLSSWFREYVYFPLGGSRVENQDTMVRNTFIVWLLTGLWHGAAWTFVLWGLFNFVCILLERLFLFEAWKGPNWFKHLYTMLAVNFGWILFRCENFYQFREYLFNLLWINGNGFFSSTAWMFLQEYAFIWIAGILLCMPTAKWLSSHLNKRPVLNTVISCGFAPIAMLGLTIVCVTYLIKGGYNPFIYFNF